MKYKIWDKQQTLITPIGEVLTPQDVIARYPMAAIEGMKFIICDYPISLGVFMEFVQTKDTYRKLVVERSITADMTEDQINALYAEYDAMSDQEVLDTISFYEENPLPAEPTAEERMAAAMEYQNLLLTYSTN